MSSDPFLQRLLEHVPALLRAGRALTGRAADAEDLAQETLIRAVQKQEALDDPRKLKAWLLSIQRNVHLNANRGLRPKLEVLDGGLARAEPEPAVMPEPTNESVGDELQAALDALAPEWREALWLREVEELSYEEIAQVQGCPVGTVRSRLARARAAMLKRLEKDDRTKEARHGRV